jgi:hypothetical protein
VVAALAGLATGSFAVALVVFAVLIAGDVVAGNIRK